jgi:type IV secretion system protein TrbC
MRRIPAYVNNRSVFFATVAALLAVSTAAHASGSNMPWESPMTQVMDSITGPVAKVISVVIIFGTGVSLAVGDVQGGFKKLLQIVFGLTIAFAAVSFFLPLFGYGGGAVF